jgi:hypothetical protein
VDTREIEALVGELETRVDRLRALYEQYFMGIEKMAPAVPQKDVERRIALLRKEQIRNTALRFRFQMIIQRYNTYQTHWIRICRQIEGGTYKRDLLRAQRRFGTAPEPAAAPKPPEPEAPPPAESAPKIPEAPPSDTLVLDPEENFAALDKFVQKAGTLPKAPPPPLASAGKGKPVWRKVEKVDPAKPSAAAKPEAPAAATPGVIPARAPPPLPPRPAATAQPGKPPALPPAARPEAKPAAGGAPSKADLSEDRLRQIYSQYVQTRRSQNESTAALTYDAMAKSLRESSEKLREKHGKTVDFEVTVKDGKTVLRPVVKR